VKFCDVHSIVFNVAVFYMLQKFGFVVHQPGALGEGRHKKPNITMTDEICGSYKMAHHFSESGDDIAECSQ